MAVPFTGQWRVRRVGGGEVHAAPAHPMGLALVTVHAGHVLAVRRHVHVEAPGRILQRVLYVAALEVGPTAGGGVAAQTHRPIRDLDPSGDRVHAFLVLPQDRLPFPAAVLGLVKIPPVPRGMADQAVHVLQLLPADLLTRQLAEAGMTGRAALGQDLAVRILHLADPLRAGGIGAEVVDHGQLAQLLPAGVHQIRGSAPPLIMLGVEEVLGLFLVALQTGLGAFIVFDKSLVAVLARRLRCGGGEPEEDERCQRDNAHGSLRVRIGR